MEESHAPGIVTLPPQSEQVPTVMSMFLLHKREPASEIPQVRDELSVGTAPARTKLETPWAYLGQEHVVDSITECLSCCLSLRLREPHRE